MITPRYYSYTVPMINFSLHIGYIYGSTEHSSYTTFHESILMNYIDRICYSLVWLILLGICLFIFINYYQLQNSVYTLIETSNHLQLIVNKDNTTIQSKDNIETERLFDFVPLQPCRLIHIDHRTSMITIDELIDEAEQTTRFTVFPMNENMCTNDMFLQICLSLSA